VNVGFERIYAPLHTPAFAGFRHPDGRIIGNVPAIKAACFVDPDYATFGNFGRLLPLFYIR
jgi:hypothetical protein